MSAFSLEVLIPLEGRVVAVRFFCIIAECRPRVALGRNCIILAVKLGLSAVSAIWYCSVSWYARVCVVGRSSYTAERSPIRIRITYQEGFAASRYVTLQPRFGNME